MIAWFELDHISRSPARFDGDKLLWLNQHYLKEANSERIATLVMPLLHQRECHPEAGGPALVDVIELLRSRTHLLPELADAAVYFYRHIHASTELSGQHLTLESCAILTDILKAFESCEWQAANLAQLLKETASKHGVKMGQVGIPLRVAICGEPQTPAIDRVLEMIGREEVIRRLSFTLQLS